jgi:hypothetical protein
MTKPVAVFRSRVIGDSRHTVRLDGDSHLVLFPSFSRYITSWAISDIATYMASGAEAYRSRCYRPGSRIGYMAGCRLVIVLVGPRGRVGLVTPTPNGHLPALFGGRFHVQLGEWGFVRWIQGSWSEFGIIEPKADMRLELGAQRRFPHSTNRLCTKRHAVLGHLGSAI